MASGPDRGGPPRARALGRLRPVLRRRPAAHQVSLSDTLRHPSHTALRRPWGFIGRNPEALRSVDELASEEQERAVNRAAVPLTEDELMAARSDNIEIRYLDKFTRTAKCALVVSGCSLRHVNGRYIERGSTAGSFLFRNVRGWVIFKRRLIEVPELGINLESCSSCSEGTSISDVMARRAQQAVSLLVSREDPPTRAQSDRSLFLEVVSAGLRQVTAEQTAQSLRNTALLASERSVAAFRRLFSTRTNNDGLENENTAASSSLIPSSAVVSNSDSFIETDIRRTQPDSSQPLLVDREELGDDEAEIGMRGILAKGIEYQVASSGFSELSSARALTEAELSLELLRTIERRESLLGEAMAESNKVPCYSHPCMLVT